MCRDIALRLSVCTHTEFIYLGSKCQGCHSGIKTHFYKLLLVSAVPDCGLNEQLQKLTFLCVFIAAMFFPPNPIRLCNVFI